MTNVSRSSYFNQLLDDWNVGSVNNMGYIFTGATDFNQPLDDWNVASLNNMGYMFTGATDFNQPLNDWNVAGVTDMGFMFYDATKFNQCLSSWADKTPPVGSRLNMFIDCDCPNKDPVLTIGQWCQGEDEQC